MTSTSNNTFTVYKVVARYKNGLRRSPAAPISRIYSPNYPTKAPDPSEGGPLAAFQASALADAIRWARLIADEAFLRRLTLEVWEAEATPVSDSHFDTVLNLDWAFWSGGGRYYIYNADILDHVALCDTITLRKKVFSLDPVAASA